MVAIPIIVYECVVTLISASMAFRALCCRSRSDFGLDMFVLFICSPKAVLIQAYNVETDGHLLVLCCLDWGLAGLDSTAWFSSVGAYMANGVP